MDKVRRHFWDTPDKDKPAAIVVDAVGMGAGVGIAGGGERSERDGVGFAFAVGGFKIARGLLEIGEMGVAFAAHSVAFGLECRSAAPAERSNSGWVGSP